MSQVRVKENESLDSALRRFKRQTSRDGIIQEVRKREHYEKPSVRRKKSPIRIHYSSCHSFHCSFSYSVFILLSPNISDRIRRFFVHVAGLFVELLYHVITLLGADVLRINVKLMTNGCNIGSICLCCQIQSPH